MYKLNKLTHEEFIRVALNKSILAKDKGARRPLAIGIYGASGVGKSSLALYWAEKLLKIIGRENMIEHVIENHIVYRSAEGLGVLKHCLECPEEVPLFINMEGREMLDSRASMSQFNKKITQALILSRAIRPLVLIFCFQRLMDIDVRVREAFNIFAKIRSYIRSDGELIPPEALYFEIRKKIARFGKVEEIAYLQPVQIYGYNPDSVVIARWPIPESFKLFKVKDRQMKEKILAEKEEEAEKEKEKQITGVLVTCSHCGYSWVYTGSRTVKTCPNCGFNTGVSKDKEKLKEEKMRKKAAQGVQITCNYCGYTWIYTGKSKYATCPNCTRKIVCMARSNNGGGGVEDGAK